MELQTFPTSAEEIISADPAPVTDSWAGRPVRDARHVDGMVTGRMHNAPRVGEPAPDFTLTDVESGLPIQPRCSGDTPEEALTQIEKLDP